MMRLIQRGPKEIVHAGVDEKPPSRRRDLRLKDASNEHPVGGDERPPGFDVEREVLQARCPLLGAYRTNEVARSRLPRFGGRGAVFAERSGPIVDAETPSRVDEGQVVLTARTDISRHFEHDFGRFDVGPNAAEL